jgi:hypothetical protein
MHSTTCSNVFSYDEEFKKDDTTTGTRALPTSSHTMSKVALGGTKSLPGLAALIYYDVPSIIRKAQMK